MKSNIDKKFREYYGLLLENFKKELGQNGIYSENIPENLPFPFIPDFGKNYEKSDFKIAFVGQDAKYNCKLGLKEFLSDPDPLKYSDILNYDSTDPDGYPEVIDYSKRKSFWGYIFKFLLLFYNLDELYNIDNWETLKDDNWDILGSFAHGNVNSIPEYPDTKESKGINKETWRKVEGASEIFNNSNHIINVFKPNVILLLHWGASEKWLPKERTEFEKFDSINLWYCFAKETNTHFYWTYHPSARNYLETDGNKVLFAIINSMKGKKIFASFPGEELLIKQNEIEYQIQKIAKTLKLEYAITTNYLGLLESGFYFNIPEWKNFEIGFQFEKNGFQDFFYGICPKNINHEVHELELKKELLKDALENPDGVATDYWSWWKWHENRNWNKQTFDEIRSGEFSEKIMKKINEIRKDLNGIKL